MTATGTGTTKTATQNPTTSVLVSPQSPMGVLLAVLLLAVVAIITAAAALVGSSLNVFVKLFKSTL